MDDITLKRISVDENDTERINNERKQISQTKHFDIERIKRTTVRTSRSKATTTSLDRQNKKERTKKTRRIKQSFSPAA